MVSRLGRKPRSPSREPICGSARRISPGRDVTATGNHVLAEVPQGFRNDPVLAAKITLGSLGKHQIGRGRNETDGRTASRASGRRLGADHLHQLGHYTVVTHPAPDLRHSEIARGPAEVTHHRVFVARTRGSRLRRQARLRRSRSPRTRGSATRCGSPGPEQRGPRTPPERLSAAVLAEFQPVDDNPQLKSQVLLIGDVRGVDEIGVADRH